MHLGRSSKSWKEDENDGDTNSNRRIWDGPQRGGKRTERIENDGDTNSNRCIWDGPQRGGKRTERIENDGDINTNRSAIDEFGTVDAIKGWKEDGKN